jgi:hypothetical protein
MRAVVSIDRRHNSGGSPKLRPNAGHAVTDFTVAYGEHVIPVVSP